MQGILPELRDAKKKATQKLQPAKPHNRKHDLDCEDELTVNDLYEKNLRDIANGVKNPRPASPPGKVQDGKGSPSPRHKNLQEKLNKPNQTSATTTDPETTTVPESKTEDPPSIESVVQPIIPPRAPSPKNFTTDKFNVSIDPVIPTEVKYTMPSSDLLGPHAAPNSQNDGNNNLAGRETTATAVSMKISGNLETFTSNDAVAGSNSVVGPGAALSNIESGTVTGAESGPNSLVQTVSEGTANNIVTKDSSNSMNDNNNVIVPESETVLKLPEISQEDVEEEKPLAKKISDAADSNIISPSVTKQISGTSENSQSGQPRVDNRTQSNERRILEEKIPSHQRQASTQSQQNQADSQRSSFQKDATSVQRAISFDQVMKDAKFESEDDDPNKPILVPFDGSKKLGPAGFVTGAAAATGDGNSTGNTTNFNIDSRNSAASNAQMSSTNRVMRLSERLSVKGGPGGGHHGDHNTTSADESQGPGAANTTGNANLTQQRMSQSAATRKSIVTTTVSSAGKRKSRIGPDHSDQSSLSPRAGGNQQSSLHNAKKSIIVQTVGALGSESQTALISMEEKDMEMRDMLQDQDRRHQLEAMVPSLKETLNQVESRIENDLEAGVRVVEFRNHMIAWLIQLINGIAGGEVTNEDFFNPDGCNENDDDEDDDDGNEGELDLFEDQSRMANVEKMLPSIKPMYDEIRRKSSIRRETATRMVEFHVSLRSWVTTAIECVVRQVALENISKREQPNHGSL